MLVTHLYALYEDVKMSTTACLFAAADEGSVKFAACTAPARAPAGASANAAKASVRECGAIPG